MGRVPFFAATLLWLLRFASSLDIDTSDGGYKEVWVSISDSVPPDESIIHNIKDLFRSSSEFLHRATNGRVYFKSVTIEVPKTWPKRGSARALSSGAFDKSDVRVDLPTTQYGDKPFTHQVKPCGKPGDFIQLTPAFLTTLKNSTVRRTLNPAYIFVHEWAHFRYGVFDEYGSADDSRYPLTYCDNNTVRLNACSRRIAFVARTADGKKCAIDAKCRLLGDCVVTFHQPKEDPVESSIMFMPYIANVSQFCDSSDGPRYHDPFAPNKQNELCMQRSTWDVISENEDFKKLPRPDISKPIRVTFQEAQEKEDLAQRVVLVLDVSGSMSGSRIGFLKEAAERYIGDIEDGSRRLAIVTFSTTSKAVHTLMPVNVNTRHGFLNAIRRLSADGRTCIGCGLKTALRLLATSSETPEGAYIVLMTDGEENESPVISKVLPDVIAAKVIVSTLALGATADANLESLATKTRGKAFAFSDLQGNVAVELESAFVSSTTSQSDNTVRTTHTLVDEQQEFTSVLEKKFRVDANAGNSTVVYVKRNSPGNVRIQARLIDPSGRPCKACQESAKGDDITIAIPSPAMVGMWTLHVTTPTSSRVEVSVQVKSAPSKKDDEPIRVSCEMGSMLVDRVDGAVVYAKVTKGKKVVLDAVVFATVYRPKTPNAPHAITIPLHDDGRDPDVHANDGTYSGYFTQFTGQGRYAVTAHVSDQKATRLANPWSGSGSFFTTALLAATTEAATGTSCAPASEYPIHDFVVVNTTTETGNTTGTVVETVDPFQRVASGGSFQVTVEILEKQVPPGDIRDLTVTNVHPGENNTLLVQLTWTWPGAHLTSGNASAVQIRVGKRYADIVYSFENQTLITQADVVEGNLNPLPSGAQHVITISIPRTLSSFRQDGAFNWNVYVAARVANSDGLKSKTSNVVPVSYVPPPVTTTVATTTEATTTEATTTEATTTEATTTEATTTEATTTEATTTEATTTEATTTEATTTEATATALPTTTETLAAPEESNGGSWFVASPWFWVLLACIAVAIVIAIVVTVSVMLNPKKRRIYHLLVRRQRPRTFL